MTPPIQFTHAPSRPMKPARKLMKVQHYSFFC